uniref:Uncharacterized protein n=1 Tax=Biomphalaria glabrata TaxID=6526 RepID=A0A2C9L6W8_BIOGL
MSKMSTYKKKTETKDRYWREFQRENVNTYFSFQTDMFRNSVKECLNVKYDLFNEDSDDDDPKDECIIQSACSEGDHETQESEGGEADLHKYFIACKKNPGHRQFIHVDAFTLNHLPEDHQDNDLYECIKVTADLTVRVNVTMSSPHRPKFYPKTIQPYPFDNMSDKRNLRTGSGGVRFVNKFQNGVRQDGKVGFTNYLKCWCRECKHSVSSSNVWWEFYVYTATHVVFDDIEASCTTLRFSYDKDDSPVVNVDKVSVLDADIVYDLCVLYCVTCDNELGNKLMEMWKHSENVREKIRDKYPAYRSKHKFNFLVSHPHGCSKQVSVGQWKDKHSVGSLTKLTYTTCTCPGSSGAPVHCVGYHNGLSNLVHSGSFKSGLNYSGAGIFY